MNAVYCKYCSEYHPITSEYWGHMDSYFKWKALGFNRQSALTCKIKSKYLRSIKPVVKKKLVCVKCNTIFLRTKFRYNKKQTCPTCSRSNAGKKNSIKTSVAEARRQNISPEFIATLLYTGYIQHIDGRISLNARRSARINRKLALNIMYKLGFPINTWPANTEIFRKALVEYVCKSSPSFIFRVLTFILNTSDIGAGKMQKNYQLNDKLNRIGPLLDALHIQYKKWQDSVAITKGSLFIKGQWIHIDKEI